MNSYTPFPKMLSEVLEAIESYYCDDKNMIVDCVMYLLNATVRVEDVMQLREWLENHNRCSRCGLELITKTFYEPHTELYPVEYEPVNVKFCPECDRYYE